MGSSSVLDNKLRLCQVLSSIVIYDKTQWPRSTRPVPAAYQMTAPLRGKLAKLISDLFLLYVSFVFPLLFSSVWFSFPFLFQI